MNNQDRSEFVVHQKYQYIHDENKIDISLDMDLYMMINHIYDKQDYKQFLVLLHHFHTKKIIIY